MRFFIVVDAMKNIPHAELVEARIAGMQDLLGQEPTAHDRR